MQGEGAQSAEIGSGRADRAQSGRKMLYGRTSNCGPGICFISNVLLSDSINYILNATIKGHIPISCIRIYEGLKARLYSIQYYIDIYRLAVRGSGANLLVGY